MSGRSPARASLATRVWARGRVRVALAILCTFSLAALFADFLAADLPLLARHKGELFVLPNLVTPAELRLETVGTLRAEAGEGDWLISPLVARGPEHADLSATLQPPSRLHWLGTDELGRDVFARLVHGARISLTVGLLSVALFALIGVVLGALAGYRGGTVDLVVGRAIELVMTFPTFFLVLCVLGLMRVKTVFPIILVIGLTRWTDVARLIRAEVLRIRTLDYVQASRALGASDWRILTRHVLPNAMGPVLVAATFGVAGAILLESGLSFLGFGVPPPTASWGELLTQAHRYVTHPGAWWLTLFPGLAIFLTVTAFNVVGEGLRDALDPRPAGRRGSGGREKNRESVKLG